MGCSAGACVGPSSGEVEALVKRKEHNGRIEAGRRSHYRGLLVCVRADKYPNRSFSLDRDLVGDLRDPQLFYTRFTGLELSRVLGGSEQWLQ